MYEQRNYLVIPSSEVYKIDFNLVHETSPETLRYSVDGSKTFVKWDGPPPEFVSDIVGCEGPYTHSQFLYVVSTSTWVNSEQ